MEDCTLSLSVSLLLYVSKQHPSATQVVYAAELEGGRFSSLHQSSSIFWAILYYEISLSEDDDPRRDRRGGRSNR